MPNDQEAAKRIVIIGHPELRTKAFGREQFRKRIELAERSNASCQIDIFGSSRVSVYCQCRSANQSGSDTEYLCACRHPYSKCECSSGIEHARLIP